MIYTLFFDLDETLVQSSRATGKLFCHIKDYFSIDMQAEDIRAIFREQALKEMASLSQYHYLKDLNIGSYDLFYLNLKESSLNEKEIEQYRRIVCQNTIDQLTSYNHRLTTDSLITYKKEHWLKYYEPFDNVYHVLETLKSKYKLIIITNGFADIQQAKVNFCHLNHYFEDVIVSSQFSIGKPAEQYFQYALKKANASRDMTWMIGDSLENDINGAQTLGMKTIYLNQNHNRDNQIHHHIENCKVINNIVDILTVIQ